MFQLYPVVPSYCEANMWVEVTFGTWRGGIVRDCLYSVDSGVDRGSLDRVDRGGMWWDERSVW